MQSSFSLTDGYLNTHTISEILKESYVKQWTKEVNTMSKLRDYSNMKISYGIEGYLTASYLSSTQRSVLAAARSGTLHLEIEKGRWRGIPREQRMCKKCNCGDMEDLEHLLIKCAAHNAQRSKLIDYIATKVQVAPNISVNLMLTDSRIYKYVANFIIDCLSIPTS